MRTPLAWVGLGCALAASSVSARTVVVSSWDDGDVSDIQAGIDLAVDGDTVEVRGEEWVLEEPIDFHGKAITVKGAEGWWPLLRVSAAPRDPARACVVFFGTRESEAAVLEGFRIRGGPGYWGLGGAIYCDAPASPTIRGCELRHGTGANQVVLLTGTARLIGCTIEDNVGIAVACGIRSSPTIAGCRIRGNAHGNGPSPAVYCDDGSTVTIANCLVADNQGSGIYCGEDDGSTVVVRSSTIAGNGGAGIQVDPRSSLELESCIVWGNGREALRVDPAGERPVVAYSCIEGDEALPGDGNIASDPRFAGEAILDWSRVSSGGAPDVSVRPGDYRLLPGSPAIDAANPSGAPEWDLDGSPRCGARADMGALEACEPLTRFIRGDCTGDGVVDIGDGTCTFWFLFFCLGCWPGSQCLEASDSNDDGNVNITDGIYTLNWLFLGGPIPPAPGPLACGADPPGSPDVGCPGYAPCE